MGGLLSMVPTGPDLSHRQLAVLNPVRLIRFGAHTFVLIFLIRLEIAFEEDDLRVAFERQNMRGEAVEEVAVVADDHGATGEVL